MAKPTKDNITGVEDFDHSAVAGLSEYQEVCDALNRMVRAMKDRGLSVGQEIFLKMVEQMAASLSYADSSAHVQANCPKRGEARWPYRAEVRGDSLKGYYRCPDCGQEWAIAHWDVNISEWV